MIDFGNVIYSMTVIGQVHEELEQEIKNACWENTAYHDNGTLLINYFIASEKSRDLDLPFYTVDHSCITTYTYNLLGVKCGGEVGTMGSSRTIMNAAMNAFHSACQSNVKHFDMHVSPA